MACATISTGSGFLSGTLAFIDCQAQVIGSYGYGALADAGSPINSALSIVLTIFIALYGLKLLLGQFVSWPAIVGAALKVGIVLTLATSWPSWRIVGFDLLMRGPFEIAQTVGLSTGLVAQPDAMIARLQAVDDAIVVMTSYGTGRLTGGVASGNELGDSFKGIALADQFSLGMGRAAYLVGTLLPFGIFRLGAGLLLAIAPLMAGLLLFHGTSSIFMGWTRGLVFCAMGTLVQWLVQAVEIALFEPWVQSVITDRQGGTLTPSAPTELFVLSLAFSGISLGLMLLFMRFIFHPPQINLTFARPADAVVINQSVQSPLSIALSDVHAASRAQITADTVSNSLRREQRLSTRSTASGDSDSVRPAQGIGAFTLSAAPGHRTVEAMREGRAPLRTSESARLRDNKA
ncbi:type IV secretion system protein [Sphingobium sp. AP49]|uniref:type IV secretion system protein n=1 Tax=Sphingobium sp. AP49 TaxID=1144307 RepID=UPI00026ED773|nr:type IV secretion system protein [Sphingobium sp. AP49]WHO38394.1 type IV secretion system protein [Sphingobium sp. AP49]